MLSVITRHLNALYRLRILKAGKKIVVGFKLQFINQVHVKKKLNRKEALKRRQDAKTQTFSTCVQGLKLTKDLKNACKVIKDHSTSSIS